MRGGHPSGPVHEGTPAGGRVRLRAVGSRRQSDHLEHLELAAPRGRREGRVGRGGGTSSEAYRGVCRWEASRETDGIRGPIGVAGTGLRPVGFLNIESLEDGRCWPSAPWQPTSANLADVKNGPMANVGQI